MRNMKLFLAAILCVSLLAFAGCGNNDDNGTNASDGTVTEENVDRNDDSTKKDDGSLTEDMADGARDAIDDVEDGVNDVKDKVDGEDDAAKGTSNNSFNDKRWQCHLLCCKIVSI